MLKKIFSKLSPLTISIIAILMGTMAYLYGIPFMELMELRTTDLRFLARGDISPRPEVVLAVVDEKSISKEGKWIWPRSKIADLVDRLSDAGTRVIAFDIGFLESDDTSKKMMQSIREIRNKLEVARIQAPEVLNYLDSLESGGDNDERLSLAMRSSDAKIVLGYFFHMEAEIFHLANQEALRTHKQNIQTAKYKLVRYPPGGIQDQTLQKAASPQSNISIISAVADYSGFFNMFPDVDGAVRWIPGVIRYDEDLYAPLSLMAVSAYLDAPLSVEVADYGVDTIKIGKLSIPADEQGRILINYRGGEKTFPHVPVTDILHGQAPDHLFQDKIVIVGATAVGICDHRVTPFGTVFPGVEIHANIVDSVLSENFLHQPAWLAVFDIMAMILSGLFLGIMLSRSDSTRYGAIALCCALGGYLLLCRYLFSAVGLILNLVYPLSVTLLAYIGIILYKYLVESRQKRFIKNAFSTYLAPSVVEHLIKSPEKLVLGGEEREITAFFSDIQGFTGIAEKLAPRELVDLLNELLTEMTDIILAHEGTVDKFEGDAIIAFFGAPHDLSNQAASACMASIEMQERLRELREGWKEQGKPELKMRIGLSTGLAVVGNMGSRSRMDYTMMGDTVNTAARLEGVNKAYGTYNLISESTCKAAALENVITRETDSIYVVGRKMPLKIYELIGHAENMVNDKLSETLSNYANGLTAYRNRDWKSAILFFSLALETTPGDGPSQTMLARCKEFLKTPPPGNWDGSFMMKAK